MPSRELDQSGDQLLAEPYSLMARVNGYITNIRTISSIGKRRPAAISFPDS
jgi:hypothetical protein